VKCPACGSQLQEHLQESAKQGRQHCYSCNRCFEADGKTLSFGAPFAAMEGLESLTVPELKEVARAEDIDLGDATRKAEITEAIQAEAQEVPSESPRTRRRG